MTNEPEFTQIPLNNQRLIALNDLKAVSGYNRNLIVPDDLPPVLSLPQIQAPLQPHLVTGQEDGSVNVHVTGGSGGAAGAPIVIDTTQPGTSSAKNYKTFSFTNGCSNFSSLIGNLRYLTGMQVATALAATSAVDGDESEWNIFAVATQDVPENTPAIALWTYTWANFSNANTYATPNSHIELQFNPPIDIYASLGVSDGFYFLYQADAKDSGYFTHTFFGYH